MEEIPNIEALVALIDDPNEEVYNAVKNRLLEAGSNVVPLLNKCLNLTENLLQHDRLEQIIKQLNSDYLVERFQKWEQTEFRSMLEGWILVSSIKNPDLISENIDHIIQRIFRDAWIELNESLTSIEKVAIINQVFYEIHHFEINTSDFHAPESCYINKLLITKKGNLISLAILYCIIAEKFNLQIHSLGYGQYVILGYYEPKISRDVYGENASPYLFFIDIERNGAIIGANELNYLIHENVGTKNKLVHLGDTGLIRLLLIYLRQCYQIDDKSEKLPVINKMLDILQN